ncbi:MAG: hypothetical protein RDA78_02970 [Roseibium sp.]|uniref:hypothetical protein n=1 Tax=Roseibium sp. TaxID=1936156 RepID=UPI003D9C053B
MTHLLDYWPWAIIVIGLLLLLYFSRPRYFQFDISPGEHASAPVFIPVSAIMSVVVSLAVLGSSLFIILSGGYEPDAQKWAFGSVGTILGFWLKPSKKET